MWKAFRKSTLKPEHAPQASISFQKFHVLSHTGDALDQVRKSGCGSLLDKDRHFVKKTEVHAVIAPRKSHYRGTPQFETVT